MKTRNKLLVSAAAAALLIAGGMALAQTIGVPAFTTLSDTDLFQDVVNGIPQAQSQYVLGKNLRAYIFGGGTYGVSTIHTGTPVLTGCLSGGTSGGISGTDYAFILTGGTTASTSCIATFSVAFTKTPICTVVSQTAYGTTTPAYTVSTTAVTITQSSQASEIYDATCVGQPGG